MRPAWEDSYEENTRIFLSQPSFLPGCTLPRWYNWLSENLDAWKKSEPILASDLI